MEFGTKNETENDSNKSFYSFHYICCKGVGNKILKKSTSVYIENNNYKNDIDYFYLRNKPNEI